MRHVTSLSLMRASRDSLYRSASNGMRTEWAFFTSNTTATQFSTLNGGDQLSRFQQSGRLSWSRFLAIPHGAAHGV